MKKFFPITITEKITETKDFYTKLFSFEVVFEADWYIHMRHTSGVEIAVMPPNLENQPAFLHGAYKENGIVFSQTELLTVLIPWADIILTGPISLISGYGILKNLSWGVVLGLCTSGIYIFGSVLVFITIVWSNNYSVFLIIPSISGFFIGLGFVLFVMREHTSILINNQQK